jgi:hypothetical protein
LKDGEGWIIHLKKLKRPFEEKNDVAFLIQLPEKG